MEIKLFFMHYRFIFIFLISFFSLNAQEKPVVVLELFTSQGCSSCPPADRLLEEIKNNNDSDRVIPVAYHVDYWDYIGWKDPFASKDYTNKQRDYAEKFLSSSIYTPQLVINGDEHFVGSDKVRIERRIKQILHRGSNSNTIEITDLKIKDKKVDFSYKVDGKTKKRNIYFLLTIDKRVTPVKRGENRNRTLTNTNIVILEKIVSLIEKEGKMTLSIPDIIEPKDEIKLIAITKDKDLLVTSGIQIKL
ncbi:thioredoxin family protein [uncultured Tenacibaculum sp.]|uniref:DUF1223 domain-containing protein n=1 Tax=uncultured Tenacibaculum sp. TaxID=174713 RepID=UPI002635294E|nr:DUF1223 domain-containing protein [uncultured Tenacibaculum sp.]